MEQASQDCEVCYKIICKKCRWEATQEETIKIQKGYLTNCPDCGWSPNN